MVVSVDTPDLKSCGQQWPCRFDPGSGYQQKSQMASTVVWDSCFWYAAAVQEPGLVPQQTGDQRQIQSIRLGQMAQSPSDKCVGIVA